jgi:glucose/arabinose dehydrogenase
VRLPKTVRASIVIAALILLASIAQLFAETDAMTERATTSVLPLGFNEKVVARGFRLPTAFTFLPDGRILVAEKAGVIRVVQNGQVLEEPFLDIRDEVNDYWDRGLITVKADPDFAKNGYVYIYYTYDHDPSFYEGPKTARLVRWTADGNVAAAGSEHVLLGSVAADSCADLPSEADCLPSEGPSHSAGDIRFDSDGNMFITIGDGAEFRWVVDEAVESQDLDIRRGKLLRITPDGQGLPDNPFWDGDPDSFRSMIWAYGFRNAFRFDLHPETEVPVVGDVGHLTWESVFAVPRGVNLGWSCYEGGRVQQDFSHYETCQALYEEGPDAVHPPLVIWSRQEGSSAVVGGVFYTGENYPEKYHNAFFYGDYIRSFIRFIHVDENSELLDGPVEFANRVGGPVDFEMGPDGDLYYLALHHGELRQVVYDGE